MKEHEQRGGILVTLEGWISATLFVFGILYLLIFVLDDPAQVSPANKAHFGEFNVTFNYFRNYFYPRVIEYVSIFAVFFIVNFKIVPRLISRRNTIVDIGWLIVTFMILGIILFACNFYSEYYIFSWDPENAYRLLGIRSLERTCWPMKNLGITCIISTSR